MHVTDSASGRTGEPRIANTVLFVDDEPHLLAGLRRMLRSERDRWDIRFASSGSEALKMIEQSPVDAIVSDMRMPGMSGAELLAAVQRSYPSTARIILSGQSDRESVLAAVRSAQQFLAKPCDVATLTHAVDRALEVRRMLAAPALQELIGGVASLLTLPTVYHELVAAMDSPDVDLAVVAKILASDVATSAAVLKLVNSGFFGLPREVSSVDSAVSLLGLENIQALVLTGSVFRMDDELAKVVDVDELRRVALCRVAIGRTIATNEAWPLHERNLVGLSCMLRDVGALILAEGMPRAAGELATATAAEAVPTDPARRAELEAAAYGCTVPEASAYLLGLWGFAPIVVHTIASQPLADDGPGAARAEHVLNFAHLRALAPSEPVPADPDGYFNVERALLWNSAADAALAL
jgi:HD-like signal output (HDOD) protein/CheY-like chemotaxis protein